MANSDTSDYETEEEMDAQTTALKAQLQYLSKYNAAEEIKSERYRREIQKMKSNLTKVRSSYEECMRNPRPLNLTVPLNLSMIKSNAEKMWDMHVNIGWGPIHSISSWISVTDTK